MSETTGWRPIETAPRDFTSVLLFAVEWCGKTSRPVEMGECLIGLFKNGKSDWPGDDWWELVGGDGYAAWVRASHWMPLPPAPEPTA